MPLRQPHGDSPTPRIELEKELLVPTPSRRTRRHRIADRFRLKTPEGDENRQLAEDFRVAHMKELAMLSGGLCGAGPSSIVASAAMQLGASRWLSEKALEDGNKDLLLAASKLANDSRQNLLAAYELANRYGQARRQLERERQADRSPLLEALQTDTTEKTG